MNRHCITTQNPLLEDVIFKIASLKLTHVIRALVQTRNLQLTGHSCGGGLIRASCAARRARVEKMREALSSFKVAFFAYLITLI